MNKLFKIILITIIALSCLPIFGQQATPLPLEQCVSNFALYGVPTIPTNIASVSICRTGYLSNYDTNAKIPVYVMYTLTPDHSIGCVARSNAFEADQSLSKDKRSDPKDYVGSGYDQGHMANDVSMAWNIAVERQSFILSNMSPQLPKMNRIYWKQLEANIQAWAYENNHTLLIYVGPIYNISTDKTIGANKVIVPDKFYKIVVDTMTYSTVSFVYPNISTGTTDISKYLTTVSDIENQTGINFPLPLNVDKMKIGNLTVWPVDLGQYNRAKKVKCKQ